MSTERETNLHAAVCKAVEILNIAPEVARTSEGREVRDILRAALNEYFMDSPPEPGEREAIHRKHCK